MFGIGSKKTSEQGTWHDDTDTLNCMQCRAQFGIFTRRHHCRQCGEIVCGQCSTHRKFLESSRTGKEKRVCDRCWNGLIPGTGDDLAAATARVSLAGGSDSAPASPTPAAAAAPASARFTSLPSNMTQEEAVKAISDFAFEGRWRFNMVFLQGALCDSARRGQALVAAEPDRHVVDPTID
jgi:hypothetical protein